MPLVTPWRGLFARLLPLLVALASGCQAVAPGGPGGTELISRRLTSDGALIGGPTSVATTGANPSIAYRSKDRADTVVYDTPSPLGDRNVFARRLTPAGAPYAATALGVAAATNDQQAHALAYNFTFNRFLVVWTDARATSAIYGQRMGHMPPSPGLYLSGLNFNLNASDDGAPKGVRTPREGL